MTKEEIQKYLLLSLTILVPVPGRLGYGIVMIIETLLLLLTGFGFVKILSLLKIKETKNFTTPIFLISFAGIFKALISIYSPETAFTLGLLFYIPPVTVFITETLLNSNDENLVKNLNSSISELLKFSLFALILYIFRDIFGYGTITFPGTKGLFTVTVFKDFKYSFMGVFWASAPGALTLILFAYILASKIIWRKNCD